MSNSKATGLDAISVKLLKSNSNVIGKSLSIKNGVGDLEWKKKLELPLFSFVVNNYPPISILAIVSKMFSTHIT